MYAVIRNYPGNSELADQLAARSDEVKELVSGISGFRGYYLLRAENGCATVSVYDDKAGADESSSRAAAWLQEHATEITSAAPEITAGEVVFSA
jgi:heme-degrading monooxygenase HmoA